MKLDLCPEDRTDMKLELERALKVFQEKYEELARQMAWLISVVYSPVSDLSNLQYYGMNIKVVYEKSEDDKQSHQSRKYGGM